MFDSHEKLSGTRYTSPVAPPVLAFILSSALLILSRPVELASGSLAVACGAALCMVLGWFNWNRHSQKAPHAVRT